MAYPGHDRQDGHELSDAANGQQVRGGQRAWRDEEEAQVHAGVLARLPPRLALQVLLPFNQPY